VGRVVRVGDGYEVIRVRMRVGFFVLHSLRSLVLGLDEREFIDIIIH
jgi:hypothetical protein